MNVAGERILIFGDSLSHWGADGGPEIYDLPPADGTIAQSSAPGAVLASILNNQGAQAVRIDANVGRSAHNFWDTAQHARYQFNSAADLIASDQAFAPTKVIVMLGTNDADSGAIDAAAMAQIRDSFPTANEVIAIGPPIFANDALNAKAQQVYDMLGQVFGTVIDARPISSTDNRAGDGVHFQAQGAQDLGQQLAVQVLADTAITLPGGFRLSWIGLGVAVLGLAGLWWWLWRRKPGRSLRGLDAQHAWDDTPPEVRFKQLLREKPEDVDIAQDLALERGLKLSEISRLKESSWSSNAGAFTISPLDPADAPVSRVEWIVNPSRGRERDGHVNRWAIGYAVTWNNELIKWRPEVERARTPQQAAQKASAIAWAITKRLKRLGPDANLDRVQGAISQAVIDATDPRWARKNLPRELFGTVVG